MSCSLNLIYPSVISTIPLVSIAGARPMPTMASSRSNRHPLHPNSMKLPNVWVKNDKVKRSRRNDNARFYTTLKFYNYNDLVKQMKSYLTRSKNICSSSIRWLILFQKRKQLITKGMMSK